MEPSKTPKRKCRKFGPGHEAFHMHQMRVINRGELYPAEILEVFELSFTVCVDGDWVQKFWTHDPELLQQCLDRSLSPDFKLAYGQGLLLFESTASRDSYTTAKCLFPLEEPGDCDLDGLEE